MKKYNGKYSLTENLVRGRGMRLLKEFATLEDFKAAKGGEGVYYEKRADGKYYRTSGQGKAGYDTPDDLYTRSYAAFKRGGRGAESQAGLAGYLADQGISATAGGRGGATDLVLSDGTACEVGDPSKYLEVGKFRGGQFVTTRTDPGTVAKVNFMNAQGLQDGSTLTPDQVQTIWAIGGDDIAIYIEDEAAGQYKAVALTQKGTNSVLGALPLLTSAMCVSVEVNNANTGASDAERMGIPFESINWDSITTYI
jgi:hypothetical protein